MTKTLGAALAALTLGLAAAGAAAAQPAPPAPDAAAAPAAPAPDAAPAPSGPPSVDWTIEQLLADPAAKAVLDKDLPALESDPRVDMVKSMSLRAVAQFPEAQIDQAKLDAIQADLAAAKPAS